MIAVMEEVKSYFKKSLPLFFFLTFHWILVLVLQLLKYLSKIVTDTGTDTYVVLET